MPLSAEEIRKEWEKKELEVKDAEKNSIIADKRLVQQRYRDIARENSELKRIEETKDTDGKPYWEKVKEEGKKMVSDAVAGYNDWAAGMSNLIRHCLTLTDAMWYDPIFPFREEIVGAKNFVVDLLWDKTGGAIADKFSKSRLSDSDLSKLYVTVEIDEAGDLSVNVTRDGIEVNESSPPELQKLKKHLSVGVVAWAKTRGFDMRVTDGKPAFYSETDINHKITQEEFKQLNADPEQGLDKFLSGRFEMPSLTTSISSP